MIWSQGVSYSNPLLLFSLSGVSVQVSGMKKFCLLLPAWHLTPETYGFGTPFLQMKL